MIIAVHNRKQLWYDYVVYKCKGETRAKQGCGGILMKWNVEAHSLSTTRNVNDSDGAVIRAIAIFICGLGLVYRAAAAPRTTSSNLCHWVCGRFLRIGLVLAWIESPVRVATVTNC